MSTRWEEQGLIQPLAADRPCGENLEDTQLLASFDAFRLFGHATPLDPTPDWSEIRTRALEALGRSKDLRLLAHLGSAVLRTDGLPAFVETLKTASEWLDTYWTETYPLVEEDAVLRRNALNCFADQMAVVEGLRRLPLVSSRGHGTFSLRDIDIASGAQSGDEDTRPDQAQIEAAFAAIPLDELKAQQQNVAGALSALKSIDAKMRLEAGEDAAPRFDPLSMQLVRMDRVLRARVASRGNGDGEQAATSDSAAAGDTRPNAVSVGAIRSRQDAIRALDAVAQFFRQNEPSSPIPLFLERAKRLVSKDFLEVLADIAPEAIPQARAAGGLKQGE
jgi:type VI secretion system protein ImpA